MHIEHGGKGFEIRAAGIKNDAFAYQAQLGRRATLGRPVAQSYDGGTVVVIALRNSQKCSCT
jgi:hypothetical protein